MTSWEASAASLTRWVARSRSPVAKAALRELRCDVHLKESFQGTLETAHTLENGDPDGENHWDKFLETPVAQAAIRAEMEEMGVTPDAYLDSLA